MPTLLKILKSQKKLTPLNNKKTDTVMWGEDLDLDPYVLRDQIISNQRFERE